MLKFINVISDDKFNGVVLGRPSIQAETLLASDNPRLDFCKALNFLIEN